MRNGLSILGWWEMDENGDCDFVPYIPDSWNELTPEEEDEIFPEMSDEDIDAMYDEYFNSKS